MAADGGTSVRRRGKDKSADFEASALVADATSPEQDSTDSTVNWHSLSEQTSADHDVVWGNLSVSDEPMPSRKERFAKPKKSKKQHEPKDQATAHQPAPLVPEEVSEPMEAVEELATPTPVWHTPEPVIAVPMSEPDELPIPEADEPIMLDVSASFVEEVSVTRNEDVLANEALPSSPIPEKQPKAPKQKLSKQQKLKPIKLTANKVRGQLPIGIALEGNTLIFSEIQRIKNGFRARRLVIKELADMKFPIEEGKADAFTEVLREVVQQERWKRRKVVVSAPAEYVMLRHITVPPMAKKVLQVAITAEVENNVSFPFEHPKYDYVILEDSCIAEPGEDNLNVIVVAAPSLDLERYVNCMRQAGLVPIRLEPGMLGMQRMVVTSGEVIEKKQLYVVLHLRYNGAELGFFEGENLLFMRHMEQKPADYPRQSFAFYAPDDEPETVPQAEGQVPHQSTLPGVTEEFDVSSYAADLGYEIDRSLNFVHYNLIKNDTTVPLLYLISAMLEVDPIVTALQDRLEQEVRVIESQLLFERPEREASPDATPWTVESARFAATALGMSLPEVSG
jgi:Tfp pilus assembly PilM family ATPase